MNEILGAMNSTPTEFSLQDPQRNIMRKIYIRCQRNWRISKKDKVFERINLAKLSSAHEDAIMHECSEHLKSNDVKQEHDFTE